MASLSKGNFYGYRRSIADTRVVRYLRQEREIKDRRIIAPYRKRLRGVSTQWRIFKRQQDAFEYVTKTSGELYVFSFESGTFMENKGQRLFLATSLGHFWHYYRQLNDSKRHHYEVIPEGSACHLYFDLEFNKTANPHLDGIKVTQDFIKLIILELRRMHKTESCLEDVLQLDASTDVKFSNHLVFPDVVFQDNIHAGYFVHQVCNSIRDLYDYEGKEPNIGECNKSIPGQHENSTTKPISSSLVEDLKHSSLDLRDLEKFMVNSCDGKKVLFCDEGVYTKNRNFRLFLSCKRGKSNPLILSKANLYRPSLSDDDEVRTEDEALFLDSLVSRVSFKDNQRVLNYDGVPGFNYQRSSNYSRSAAGGNDMLLLDGSETFEGYSQSPYPEIDKFVTTVVTMGGVQGYIRRWVYFHQGEKLVYDIAKNKWCHNIGRPHKSNNIIIVADILNRVYYQKCHDPECKKMNYMSNEIPLPPSILPSALLDEVDDDNDEELDDDTLLRAIGQSEKMAKQEEWFSDEDPLDDDDELMKMMDGVEKQIDCVQDS